MFRQGMLSGGECRTVHGRWRLVVRYVLLCCREQCLQHAAADAWIMNDVAAKWKDLVIKMVTSCELPDSTSMEAAKCEGYFMRINKRIYKNR